MNELIQRLTQRVGLSEDQARNAAETVIGFLKERLPSGLAGQVDAALGSEGTAADIGKKAAGLFGQKG